MEVRLKYILWFFLLLISPNNHRTFEQFEEEYGMMKSLKISKGGNQKSYIEEEQTTQWQKEKVQKRQTTIYKTYT